MPHGRPESIAPAEIYYNNEEARKYMNCSRIRKIQCQIAERAIELLGISSDNDKLILDIGCGSGLSGDVLDSSGFKWIGVDISSSMLDVCMEQYDNSLLVLNDIGQGLPFKPASFDGCISISAIQWLCNAETNLQDPVKRLFTFFSSLYSCLKYGAKAILQFYPSNQHQITLITEQAARAGFGGGLFVDFPNSSKAKKFYLNLFVGRNVVQLPKPLGCDSKQNILFTKKNSNELNEMDENNNNNRATKKKLIFKSKAWIKNKKEKARKKGKDVCFDSKYTGRKRKPKF